MITIVRYRNDSYFGLEGKIEYPTTSHSGYINEERRLRKWQEEKLEVFEEKRKGAIRLNKVHAKKALDEEIPEWEEIFKQQLRDIEYKVDHINDSFPDQLWKREYTFYHLNETTIEKLTLPTVQNPISSD